MVEGPLAFVGATTKPRNRKIKIKMINILIQRVYIAIEERQSPGTSMMTARKYQPSNDMYEIGVGAISSRQHGVVDHWCPGA